MLATVANPGLRGTVRVRSGCARVLRHAAPPTGPCPRSLLPSRMVAVRTFPADGTQPDELGGSFELGHVKKVSVHGRHVEVTKDLEERVLQRLGKSLKKLMTAEYLEAEGGLREVDVRLMNTQAEIRLHPERMNKNLHDTYLRRGEIHCIAQDPDAGVMGNFDQACEQLERKLKQWKRPAPSKVNYGNRSSGSGANSSIGGTR